MWLELFFLHGISLKLRKPFSHAGAWRQFTASKLTNVSRWQRRGEGTGKRKSNPKTGRSICWSCSDTVRLPSLCPQSPAIMITCLLQPLHQATSFALARALFSSFSFCSVKFQLKCFLSYCLDHSSPSLCSL